MLKKEDGLIDWKNESLKISNLVRGLTPWPGAFCQLQGNLLKIFKGSPMEGDSENIHPGAVTDIGKEGIKVSTGKGFFLIKELQLQNHKRMKVDDFLRGHKHRIHIGTILS